jgi:hypothetical protein
MRYVMTFVWSFLLVAMLNYVVGAIADVPFEFMPGVIVSVILSVLIIILGEAFPKGPVSDH